MAKTALITGATSGLGYEFVKLFAGNGYDLVVVARNTRKLVEIREVFSEVNVTVITKDLSIRGAAKEVYDEVAEKGIEIEVLVNNAGFGLMGKFDELSVERQSEMIHLNIAALTELTHYVLPGMKRRKRGRILNVASMAAFLPGPLMAVYYATKAYVLSFSEGLAEELDRTGVTVTALCPGATKTKFGEVANVAHTKMFSSAMAADVVAKQGYDALMRGKRVVVTGGSNKAGAVATKLMPRRLSAKIAKSITSEK